MLGLSRGMRKHWEEVLGETSALGLTLHAYEGLTVRRFEESHFSVACEHDRIKFNCRGFCTFTHSLGWDYFPLKP